MQKKKTQTKPKLEKKQSTSLVASTVAVLISGVRTEAQDIVRSSEAVVRSFSANARARLRRQELLASRGRHNRETQLSFIHIVVTY